MNEELNINALELDSNEFTVLPEGDYHFKVSSHEISIAESDKLPINTKQVTVMLDIPSENGIASVRHRLNIYKKALFAVRQFADCIGLTKESGRVTIDLNQMDGKTGICHVITQISNRGNEYNQVETFYSPSKAPNITDNDDAWEKYQTEEFKPIDPGVVTSPDVPF